MKRPTKERIDSQRLLPTVALENEQSWSQVEASDLGDRMKRALQRVAAGESFRAAATAEGYRTWSDLYRYAKRYGLLDVRTERLLDDSRRIARLSAQELERRLLEDPESLSDRDLVVANGVALDKIAKRERWGQEPEETDYLSAFDKLAAKLADTGGKVTLSVDVAPRDELIDVVPQASDQGVGEQR